MKSPLEARVRVLGVHIFKYEVVVERKMSRGQNVERHFKKSLQWKWMVFKKWLLLKNSIRRLLDESTDSSEKKSNIVFFSFDFYFSNFFPVKKSVKGELCQKFFKAIFNDAAFWENVNWIKLAKSLFLLSETLTGS